MKLKNILVILFTNILLSPVFAEGFWDDYQSTKIKYKVGTGFLDNASGLTNAIWGLIQIAYYAAIVITMIAFVVATFSLVVHSDDNAHRKVEAKHELWGSLITLAVLGGAGLIFQLIVALLSI